MAVCAATLARTRGPERAMGLRVADERFVR
jgi:hypothetical protein